MNKVDFIDWVEDEIKKVGIKRYHLAKTGGIDSGYVSHVMNREQQPGYAFCQAVAKALNIPESEVLWRAGLSQEKPIGADIPGMYEVIESAKKLTEQQRKQLVVLIDLLKSGLILVPTDEDSKLSHTTGRKAKATIHLEAE